MAHPFTPNPHHHPEPAARATQGRVAPQPSATLPPTDEGAYALGEASAHRQPEPITHVSLRRCRMSLIKGEQRWRFRWERGSEAALISAVADFARNPRMDFDWFDAAIVCRHIAQPASSAAQISPPNKSD
jgi:hypothetical protein